MTDVFDPESEVEAVVVDDDEPPRGPRRGGRFAIVLLVLVVIPLSAIFAVGGWYWLQLDPPGKAGAAVEVHVDRGCGVSCIGKKLSADGIIGSSLVFAVYTRMHGGGKDFQAGTYTLHKRMGVRAAVTALSKGPRIDYSEIKAIPGLWLQEVADLVGKMPGRSGQAFSEFAATGAVRSKYQPAGAMSLEGLLWPDTYKIADSEDEIDVLKTMVKTFDEHADALGLATATTAGLQPYQIITVASLIQQEAKVDTDRPLIASVIYNRLKQNMPLQIDASVIFGRGDARNTKLSEADLQTDTPYNTYLHTGLPPTPIGSITDASLIAALAPAQTDFLYYVVADKEGHHAFAAHVRGASQERRRGPGAGAPVTRPHR